jgi:putative transposase
VLTLEEKRACVEPNHPQISVRRQCDLLCLNRSSFYSPPTFGRESLENLEIMELIDKQYTDIPTYGNRRMTAWLRREGYDVNRKRVQRLMRLMGLEGLAPIPAPKRKGGEAQPGLEYGYHVL